MGLHNFIALLGHGRISGVLIGASLLKYPSLNVDGAIKSDDRGFGGLLYSMYLEVHSR